MQHSQSQNKLSPAVIEAFVLGAGLTAASLRGNAGQQKPPVQPPVQALELQNAFEQVADHLNPSIVFIRSRQAAKAAADGED